MNIRLKSVCWGSVNFQSASIIAKEKKQWWAEVTQCVCVCVCEVGRMSIKRAGNVGLVVYDDTRKILGQENVTLQWGQLRQRSPQREHVPYPWLNESHQRWRTQLWPQTQCSRTMNSEERKKIRGELKKETWPQPWIGQWRAKKENRHWWHRGWLQWCDGRCAWWKGTW